MKKLLKLIFVVVTIICIALTGKVYATSLDCNMEIQTEKATYAKGEEFIANVYISNINSDKGVIALQAILDYNKNDLTILEMNGKNGWDTPAEDISYNSANGKMALTRNALGKNNEVVFEIKFKVNGNSASTTSINLKDIIVTNGDDSKDINVITKALTIGTSGGNQGGNNNNQGGNNNNQGGNNNNQGGNNNNQGGNNNNQGGNNNNQGNNNNNQGGNNNNQGNNNNNQGGNNNNQGNNSNQGNNNQNGSNGTTGSTSKNQVDNQSTNNMPKTGVTKHPVLFILIITAVGTCAYFYVNMKYAYSKPYGKPFTKK